MITYEGKDRPRKFDVGGVYFADGCGLHDTNDVDLLFVIVGFHGKWWDDWSGPDTYVGLDLMNGSRFEFHKTSIVAGRAVPFEP